MIPLRSILVGCILFLAIAISLVPVVADNVTVTQTTIVTTVPTTTTTTVVTTTTTPTTTATTVPTTTTTTVPSTTVTTVPTTTTTTTTTTTSPTTTTTTVASAPPLVAAFTATPLSGTAPLAVQFTDQSTGSPVYWDWDFGDGGTSTLQSPSYTYTTAGTYSVSLTVSNTAVPSNSKTQTNLIVVNPGATTAATTATTTPILPVALFTASPISGTAPLSVQFTDESTGSPTSWEWDFGDGNENSTESPLYTYTTAGTYTVSLTATNGAGSNTSATTQNITVTSGAPVAAFSATPLSGEAPLTVQFTDASTGTPTSWEWTFGDGTTGNVQNPSHVYASPGTYTASLIAVNGVGSSTNGPVQTITVNGATATETTLPLFTTEPTYAVTAESTTGSVSNWLAQQNAIATPAPTKKSPGFDALAGLICIAVAGIFLANRK